MERTIEKIPTYALCALINDDWTGLDDEDINNIKYWRTKNNIAVICPVNDEEFFTHYPAFGLACDVLDCICEIY